MLKKGQFYLITTIIIIAIIAGFATLSNYTQKKPPARISQLGDELKFESGKVIDYANNDDGISVNSQLLEFTKDYSQGAEANNFYYIFGDTSSITLAGCKKLENGNITLEDISGITVSTLDLNERDCENPGGSIESTTLSGPPTDIVLVVNNLKYSFTLKEGQNFYFIVSKEIEGENYVATNSKK